MRKYLTLMRKKQKLTQYDVAERIGIWQSNYSQIENGTRQINMDLSMMKKLATAFGVPLEEIVKAESKYQDERVKRTKKAN